MNYHNRRVLIHLIGSTYDTRGHRIKKNVELTHFNVVTRQKTGNSS